MEDSKNMVNLYKQKSPIVIFAYKRPKHLKKLFESLIQNEDYESSKVYIFIDGIKHHTDKQERNAVLDVVEQFQNNHTLIHVREKNLGLAENITQGLDFVFKLHEMAIILEDDLIVGKHFLEYMNQSLEIYRSNKKIWHISGWNPLDCKNGCDIYVSQAMFCWGWGTWKDKWKQYRRKNQEKFMQRKKIYKLNYENCFLVWDQIIQNELGLKKTWAAFWALTIFQNNGYCINPRISLVYNNGLDGTGENSHYEEKSCFEDITTKLNVTNIEIRELPEQRKKLGKFFKKKVNKISYIISQFSYFTNTYGFTVRVYYHLVKFYFRLKK